MVPVITNIDLYYCSTFLDAFDGYAARTMNQCSKLGAIMDLLTDCVTTSLLLMGLSVLYPQYIIW